MPRTSNKEAFAHAIDITAPGTALRSALDMILAGRLGALICIGDSESVLASGNDGFPLNIAFTSHRLFELAKMDGAIVIDSNLSTILRANFHLNPDSTLPTSETGMRHRTAARISMQTDAVVISVSERRSVVNLYVGGRSYELASTEKLLNESNQTLVALQIGRNSLDRALERLTTLEFEDSVTIGDITQVLARFQNLQFTADALRDAIEKLGSRGDLLNMQLVELTSGLTEQYTMLIRDYASNSSEESAAEIRAALDRLLPEERSTPSRVAEVLGYEDLPEDVVITPLGLRTLARVTIVNDATANKIANEYGSLKALVEDMKENPGHLGDLGVNNPAILVDSLYRMWGKER